LHLLTLANHLTRSSAAVGRGFSMPSLAFFAVSLFESSKKGDAYNLLWALVFGFATLNILSLVAKRFEPHPNRMSFGEILAVMTVLVAVFLLGWEMLYLFKILPIRLSH
jgi:FtsH-binding integral membrane protein